MSLSLSQASIPEICQKCGKMAAVTGASATYMGSPTRLVEHQWYFSSFYFIVERDKVERDHRCLRVRGKQATPLRNLLLRVSLYACAWCRLKEEKDRGNGRCHNRQIQKEKGLPPKSTWGCFSTSIPRGGSSWSWASPSRSSGSRCFLFFSVLFPPFLVGMLSWR